MTRDSQRGVSVRCLALVVVTLALIAPLAAAPGQSFVWKATRNGSVVYLAGSIHMLAPDAYPLHPAFERAFTESDLLVEEVDIGEMLGPEVQMKTLMRGMLPPAQTLDKVLTPETLALLNKAAGDVGAPLEALQRLKPWMIALTIEGLELRKAGFDPELGLDMRFYQMARKASKSVQGLETVDYQISRFDNITLAQQDRLLAGSINERRSDRDHVKTHTEA